MNLEFSLHWLPNLENEVTAMSRGAFRHLPIRAICTILEYALRYDPYTSGRYLHEGLWCIENGPLKLTYEIDGRNRTVTIVAIRCAL
jgi:hypothetical protein